MLKSSLKSTVSSFVIYLSILSPISAMVDDDLDNHSCSSSSYSLDSFNEDDDYSEQQYKLAKSLELGRDVPQDINKARKIYEDLSEELSDEREGYGDVRAAVRLGMLDEKDKNFRAALMHYKKAWKYPHRYEKAGMKCAEFYEKGLGSERNLLKALNIYETIAFNPQGRDKAKAAYRAGFLMQFNPELEGSFRYFYEKAAKLGSKEAQFLMGYLKRFTPDKTEAINWFRKSSTQGYLPSHFALIEMILKGHISGKGEDAAFNIFQRIYKNESFKQQWMVFFKINDPQNTEEAFQLFKAKLNIGAIELFLANTYFSRDARQYISFLKLSSEKRHPLATFMLGEFYEKGWYKSFSKAFNWFRAAALRNHPKAINKQRKLFCFLLPEFLHTDYEGDHFNPREHNLTVIASLYNHPDFGQAMMTHWNKLLNSPNREEMGDISSFIIENRRALEISEDSDFFLEVVGKKAISENVVNPKSPFKAWPALLQKRVVPVDVRSLTQDFPLWESEGRQWRFNPERLEDFGKEVHIDPTTVPLITQNDLIGALDKIQAKLTENPEAIQSAMDEITKVHNGDIPLPFEDLKTFALGYNGRSFFMSSFSKDSIEGAQLKCTLNYIKSFSDEGGGLSAREVKLINFLMSVNACEIGQESGLTSYYQVYVPTHFKYSVTGDLFSPDHPEIQPSKYVLLAL